MGRIKAVLFDLHGTLVQKGGRESLMRALHCAAEFLRERGYPQTFDDYFQAWTKKIKEVQFDGELREPSFEEWYFGILDALGIRGVDRSFIEGLNHYFMRGFEGTTTLFPATHTVLSDLKGRGYALALVSNSMAENTAADLERTGLVGRFDLLVISSEVGRRKPHPLMFQRALEGLGISASEGVFVGDDAVEDIWGAKRVGLRAILVSHVGYRDALDRDEDKRREGKPDAMIGDLRRLPALVRGL